MLQNDLHTNTNNDTNYVDPNNVIQIDITNNDTNNVKFNANKFELLGYGKEQEIKYATTYKPFDETSTTKNKSEI